MPIYMIVADASPAESHKLLREHNIRLLSFPNLDGSYNNLIQTLRMIDKFVVPRSSSDQRLLDFPDASEAENAVALHVHSSLGLGANDALLQRTLQPQILFHLSKENGGINRIIKEIKPDLLKELSAINQEMNRALESLEDIGHIQINEDEFTITSSGKTFIAEIQSRQNSDEDQFYGSIRKKLEKYGSIEDVNLLIARLKAALVNVFRRRGLAAAELLFRASPFEPSDMPELFSVVFPAAAEVEDYILRAEYCEEVMSVLTHPNEDQKRYISNLAQGFFAFHMFGLDPSGQDIRRRLAKNTVWLLDSNVIMPLVAKYSSPHKFMSDLVAKMSQIGIRPVTTNLLVEEVDRGLKWMQRKLQGVPNGHEMHRLLSVIQQPEYSENLFIDSFINGHVAGAWKSMQEFHATIDYSSETCLRNAIESTGIEILDTDYHSDEDSTIQVDSLRKDILQERERSGTFSGGNIQVDAEAEALQIIRDIRENGFKGNHEITKSYFVSTSRVLDKVYFDTDGLITWNPETLYNHLVYLVGSEIDPDSEFNAITTSYYSAGISIIDENAYRHYFKPAISEARATLEREIVNYNNVLDKTVHTGQEEISSVQQRFDSTPDLEKPLFVEQMGWKIARQKDRKLKLAEKAREEADNRRKREIKELKLEYERKNQERQRHEEGRRRNLADPKRQRKLKKQAKKRKRNK